MSEVIGLSAAQTIRRVLSVFKTSTPTIRTFYSAGIPAVRALIMI